MPTRAELARLTAANDELTALLERAIRRAWGALGAATVDEKRDVMLDVLPGFIREHGQVAATIAAEFFEATTGATATIIDPIEDEAVLESTRYLAGRLYDGREAAFLTGITSMATRNVLQHGRSTTYESAARTPGVFYARAPEPGACNWCLLLSSRGAVYASSTEAVKVSVARGKGGRRPGEDFHDSCVVGDTFVSGPATHRGLRRHYEGKIVTLVTAAGRELTITPNHPVLTDRGWVPAGDLQEGDDLVSSPGVDGQVVGGPHEDQRPARIEDFVRALSVVFPTARSGVPTSTEEFHGDGFDSEVDVVTVDELFRNEVHAPLDEPISELEFEVASRALSLSGQFLNSSGAGSFGLRAGRCASHGGMGGSRIGLPFRNAHVGHADAVLLGSRSRRDAGLGKPSAYDATTNAIGSGEGEHGFTFAVPTGKVAGGGLLGIRRVSVERKFDPQTLRTSEDGARAYAELGSDLLHRLAGSVVLDRLVDKRVREFSGHVYNLETVEGWYNANGITVSNCRCEAIAARGDDDLPYDAGALYDKYKDAWYAAGGTGATDAEVAAKMREMFGGR